jgi:hypothetical protein
MSAHVIGNPVPTPEEMGEILGLSSDRVAAVRRIMSTPNRKKTGRDSQGSAGANRPNLRKGHGVDVEHT